jgi:hypothetical protein
MRRPNLGRVLGGRARRRVGAALALLAAVLVVVALVLGASSSSPKAAGNSGSASGATTVERRDLVETDTESGTLSYANPQTVYNRLSGTITWLPSVGQVIKPGQALFKVAGEPVLLMDGTTPAYRELTPADSAGEDILELNRNLVDLGYNPDGIVVDDTWQAATTAGVEALQASRGETETGTLSLGKVVFLPGDQLISTVETTLGSTGGSSNPSSGSNASDPVGPAAPQFVSLEKPTAPKHRPNPKPSRKNKMKTLEALIALLNAEIAELKASRGSPSHSGTPSSSNHGANPSSSNSGSGSSSNHSNSSNNSGSSGSSGSANSSNSGSGGGSASAILQSSSTQLIVTVDLDASKQTEARVGEPVTVELPAGNTVNGRVTAVSPVAQSSSNSGSGSGNGSGNGNSGNSGNSGSNGNSGSSGSTIPVTITLSGHHTGAGLDQAAVSVNFSQAKASNVLSVPVTALLATAGGGYAVQAAAVPHRLIPVTTGLFAAGYVQISGAGIYPGLQVTDSQG